MLVYKSIHHQTDLSFLARRWGRFIDDSSMQYGYFFLRVRKRLVLLYKIIDKVTLGIF